MKPRITLAETDLPDGTTLILQEHDQRRYLIVSGQQIAGPATEAAEDEVARLACAPFRPVRQPKIWLAGLALGRAVSAVAEALPQKRATIIVGEPLAALPAWHRAHLPNTPLADPRVHIEPDAGPTGLQQHAGSLHAIIVHLETAPVSPTGRPLPADRRWLSAAYDALQQGGLLAIAASRYNPQLSRRLQQAGFSVAEHQVPAAAAAKKPRLQPIWLARKGKAAA